MKTTKWMASLALGTALLAPVLSANAQYVQIPIGMPIAPGCGPGESWTKNGVRYQCETPQPSCQYGFASGPVWTGVSWSFSCNGPPAPTQPTPPTITQTGVTVVSTVSLTIYSDGSGVIGGSNNEPNNSWSGSCASTSTVIQNNMSDGSVIYTQGGSPVSITVGSQLLYWLHVPGTCSGNNTK
jgi:hypothetical protein